MVFLLSCSASSGFRTSSEGSLTVPAGGTEWTGGGEVAGERMGGGRAGGGGERTGGDAIVGVASGSSWACSCAAARKLTCDVCLLGLWKAGSIGSIHDNVG